MAGFDESGAAAKKCLWGLVKALTCMYKPAKFPRSRRDGFGLTGAE